MKVSVAAQTLSNSVAEAIDFLREDMELPEFAGSAPTTAFIRWVDRSFDMLNSKNPYAAGFKAALRLSQYEEWDSFFQSACSYFASLRNLDSDIILQTRRKTPILGFIVTMTSVRHLANEVLHEGFSYLMTYKLSQDHLELLFSKIRRFGGWSNNPTAQQFRVAIRKLLMQNDIKASNFANISDFDDTRISRLDFRKK